MIYVFRCNSCVSMDRIPMVWQGIPVIQHYMFEVQQPMNAKHTAKCPVCGTQAERVFTSPTFTMPGSLFNKDGSRMDEGKIPRVYTGHNKFFSGF